MTVPVSVCIPAFNEEKTIVATIDSVLGQDYAGVTEILVCANGCTDRTEALVRGLAGDHPEVRCITTDTLGKPNAWNLLIEHAANDFTVFVDGDVVLNSPAVRLIASKLESTGVVAVGGATGPVTEGLDWFTRLVANRSASHGCLVGSLYGVSLERLRGRLEARGYVRMPEEVINEDVWLTMVIGDGAWTLELDAIAYNTPPRWYEMPRLELRRERARRQLAGRFGHLSAAPPQSSGTRDTASLTARVADRARTLFATEGDWTDRWRAVWKYLREFFGSKMFRFTPAHLWHKILKRYAAFRVDREDDRQDSVTGWETARSSKEVPRVPPTRPRLR